MFSKIGAILSFLFFSFLNIYNIIYCQNVYQSTDMHVLTPFCVIVCLAVVNLTLIDLPGLTKVAVGMSYIISHILVGRDINMSNEDLSVCSLQRDNLKVLFKTLKTWFDLILRR